MNKRKVLKEETNGMDTYWSTSNKRKVRKIMFYYLKLFPYRKVSVIFILGVFILL